MKGYFHPVKPEKYPLFAKRHSKAITRGQLGDKVNFVSLRGFETDSEGNLLNIAETIDAYTREFPLCDVIWPVYPTLFAPNFGELVEEAKKRGLFMFDFWGYVPGSQPQGDSIWGEYTPPEEALRLLEGMGDLFIGFDNGEQDGRYIGSFAPGMCPAPDNRRRLYQNFQAHFEKLEGHMQYNIALLASLNYLHSFAKEGNTIILGAETAQALPNVNTWFSYIRGAGKQYGLLWFGNASVWNRWGWKNYERIDGSNPYEECGPDCGTSLSLLKRLIYLEYFYGSDLLGYEAGWILEKEHLLPEQYLRQGEKHQLSPIGVLQVEMRKFAEEHPDRGVQHTPVCLYLDFYNGFTPPRHLYSREIYRTWGNHSFERGDHQLHALFRMLYPGYEDAGFFRNEKGFLTETPFGDIADVIFSDAEESVLEQYELAVVCGNGKVDAESQQKLLTFARNGGTVLLFGNKLCGLRPELLCGEGDTVLATRADGSVLVLEKKAGSGRVLNMLGEELTKSENPADYDPANRENEEIVQPYQFVPEAEAFLSDLFRQQQIIGIDNPMLGYAVNEVAPDRFVLTVTNNRYCEEAFSIVGPAIRSVTEWKTADIAEDTPGYFPKKAFLEELTPCRTEGDYTIRPMDIRVFEVCTAAPAVEEKPEITFPKKELPPVYVTLAPAPTLQDAYLDIPWFENYFAGVKADARYLEQHDEAFLKKEGAYFQRRNCRLAVDFSPMLNHYPDLSLACDIPGRMEESIARICAILKKSRLYGCDKAILSLHRGVENMCTTQEELENKMKRSLSEVAAFAAGEGITVYLQNGRSMKTKIVFSSAEDVKPFMVDGLRFAYSTAHGLGAVTSIQQVTLGSVVHKADRGEPEDIREVAKVLQPAALLLAAPGKDDFGQFSDLHRPLSESPWADVTEKLPRDVDFICLDAVYDNADQIFADYQLL